VSRPLHPIFVGPLPVDLNIETTPTPPDYSHYSFLEEVPKTLPTVAILKKKWDPLHLPVGYRPDDSEPGLVTSDAGFLDSPDMESIAGGIHLKGVHYVAIGRQGHVLQWGFFGTAEEMTEVGRRVFINAVAYIARFKDAPILALRQTAPRDSLALTLGFLDEAGDRRKGVLEREFGDHVPAGVDGDRDARKAWYVANRPYLRYEGPLYGGHYVVDEDAKELGIANDDAAILDRAVLDLGNEKTADRSLRLLRRYTGKRFTTAAEWHTWLDSNRPGLYFSDWYGYEFHSKNAKASRAEVSTMDPAKAVQFEMIAYRRGDDVIVQLKTKIDPQYHIYSANRHPPGTLPFDVRVASGSPFSIASPPVLPSPKSGNVYGHFTVDMKLKGKGETVALAVDYQACTEEFCLVPTTGREVTYSMNRPE